MAVTYNNVGYGFGPNPLPTLAQPPILSPTKPGLPGRAPTVNDKTAIGTIWVWVAQNETWILTSIVNNLANWEPLAGGALTPLSLNLPNTNAAGTIGFISFGGILTVTNTGPNNIFVGGSAGNPGGGVTGSDNAALGFDALASLTTGGGNSAVGEASLATLTTGNNNTAVGFNALGAQTTSAGNVAIGRSAGALLTTGAENVFIGDVAADTLLTGNNNTIVGSLAGDNYTGAESNNILIDNSGVVGEGNVIRIGTQGAGAGQQNACWIAGIRGTTTVNANAIAVLIDSAGQLGTVSSSRRYKNNIKDMDSVSEALMKLRPVTFTYKSDKTETTQYGLIAEEATLIMPNLVVNDEEGIPETVKYHDLPTLLLNEVQKLRKEVDALKSSK